MGCTAHTANLCENLFLSVERTPENFIRPFVGEDLKVIKNIHNRKNFVGEDNAIGYQGIVKIRQSYLSIELSENTFVELITYGEAYKVNAEWYMDVRITDKSSNLKLAQRKTKADSILDQVKFDDLIFYLSKSMKRSYETYPAQTGIPQGSDVLVVKTDSGYALAKYISANKNGIFIELNQIKKHLTYEEAAYALLTFSQKGTDTLKKLFQSGIEGTIYKSTSKFGEIMRVPGRELLKITAVNHLLAKKYGAPFSDNQFVKMILSFINRDEPILFDLNASEYKAVVIPPKYFEEIGLKSSIPFVAITNKAERAILAHELKHRDDHVSGLSDNLIDELNAYFDTSCPKCTSSDILIAYQIVSEQRAYATQFEFGKTISPKDPMKVNGLYGEINMTAADYELYMTTKEKNIFDNNYAKPFAALVKKLQSEGISTHVLIQIMNRYMLNSEVFKLP